VTTALNDYLDLPYVAQAFAIKREVIQKKTGEESCEIICGITNDQQYHKVKFGGLERIRPALPRPILVSARRGLIALP
jgi:hypothetical protein